MRLIRRLIDIGDFFYSQNDVENVQIRQQTDSSKVKKYATMVHETDNFTIILLSEKLLIGYINIVIDRRFRIINILLYL